MAIIRRIPWTIKPPPWVGIDWTHPLTRGLVFAHIANDGTGFPIDLVSGKRPVNGVGSGTTGAVKDGSRVVEFDGSTNLEYGRTGADEVLGTGTVLGRLRNTLRPNNRYLISSGENSNGFGFHITIDDQGTLANGYHGIVNNGAHESLFTSGANALPNPCEDFWHTIGVSWNGTNEFAYSAGSLDNTTSNGAVPTAHANRVTKVGSARDDVGLMTGFQSWAFVWDRLLSAAEHKSIYDNPWQIFQPRTQIIPVSVAADIILTPGTGALTLTGQPVLRNVPRTIIVPKGPLW